MITAPVMRYHGGKFRLAPWIIQHFPPHKTYVEAFGGAGSVLMQKTRSYGEVYNDLDGNIVTVMRVLQDEAKRQKLQELLYLTPFARAEFDLAYEDTDDEIELARRVLIRSEMGFGSAGATKGATGFRVDITREYSNPPQLWARFPERIAQFTDRLRGVLIENRPALSLIDLYDSADTLFYLDPPYMPETREQGRMYRHEMSESDHIELLSRIKGIKGMAIISGYPCALYDDQLSDWIQRETESRIAAFRGTGKRKEVLWISPAAADRLSCNYGLFASGL